MFEDVATVDRLSDPGPAINSSAVSPAYIRIIIIIIIITIIMVGGAAQRLRRRSLAGGLSPIYARSTVDM